MFISGYGNDHIDALIKEFDNPDDDAPVRTVEKRTAALLKKALGEAYDDALAVINDNLSRNMSDAIRDAISRAAAGVVESMLAGDEKTFGELFQFHFNWKDNRYYSTDRLPLGIDLRRKLFQMHRDLFENQMIEDLEGELAALKRHHKLRSWRTMVEGDL